MRVSLAPRALAGYLAKQLNAFFPDGHPVAVDDLLPHLDLLLAMQLLHDSLDKSPNFPRDLEWGMEVIAKNDNLTYASA